jgi:hypothetical protein
MAIDKLSRPHPLTLTIRDHLSPNGARCFYQYDKSRSSLPATKTVPSILRRRMKYSKPSPLRIITSRVNNNCDNRNNSTTLFSCPSSAGKRIKIILHHDDYPRNNDDEPLPASFTPPPSNTLMVRPKAVTPPPPVSTHKVSFFHKVQVLRIPSRKHYPEDMKKNLWASLSEITENAKRNSIEYTAEGWDWRTVLEEKDMYRHPRTGEYVHPIHVHREYQKRAMAERKRQEKARLADAAATTSEPPQTIAREVEAA